MAIYLNKLNTKLQAILSKDVDSLVANKVYLPFLGNTYTKSSLQKWLSKRSTLLDNAKTLTETQINALRDSIYNSLSVSDKLIADKIISGQPYTLNTDADGYEKLVGIVLYTFITTP